MSNHAVEQIHGRSAEDALALASCVHTPLTRMTIQYPSLNFAELKEVSGSPNATLGHLHELPLELQQHILASLTITSLSAFAKVNRHARQVVFSLPSLRFLVTMAPGCLSVLIRTRAADWLTPADIRTVMGETQCHHCSSFTTMVDLHHCRRSCLTCLMAQTPETSVACKAAPFIFIDMGMPHDFYSLRTIRKIPNTATPRSQHGNLILPLISMTDPKLYDDSGYDTAEVRRRHPRLGLPFSLSTHLMLPVYDAASSTTYHGLMCRGCQESSMLLRKLKNPHAAWRTTSATVQYDREAFLDHIKQCRRAEALLQLRRSFRNATRSAK